MTKLSMVAIMTGALSLSAILSFHPSQRYLSMMHGTEEALLLPTSFELWESRVKRRRKRTLPPASSSHIDVSNYRLMLQNDDADVPTKDWHGPKDYHSTLCGSHARGAAQEYPHYYPKELILGPQSRVVITNILSTVGMNLALALATECGVESILGIDAMLPNTRRNRIKQAVNRYAMLKRRVPKMDKLMLPSIGVLSKSSGEMIRLLKFDATHVVHIVPSYLGEENKLYPMRDKKIAMEQLLELIREKKPHLLYAGPNLMMEQVLASSYRGLYGISSVGIELPRLYGPWGDMGSWGWTVAENIIRLNTTTLNHLDTPQDSDTFIYVEDATTALIAAMQLSYSTMFNLTTDTTKASLESAISRIMHADQKVPSKANQTNHFENLIQWKPTTRSQTGVRQLLSWHYSQTHPYGTPPHKPQPSYVTENYHYPFPCASECSILRSCRPSSYDTVLRTTRKLTKNCKIVIYMVDYKPETAALPPAVTKPSNDTLCQLAFVSNSTIRSRGWSLVYVQNAIQMTEAERLLPKLSPGRLFDRSVLKALYVEPMSVKLPSGDDIRSFVNSVDPSAKKAKEVPIERPGTPIVKYELTPETPARTVMLLGHARVDMNSSSTQSTPLTVAKRYVAMAKETNVTMTNRHAGQLKLYEHTVHVVLNGERRLAKDLGKSWYKGFPFQFLNSTMLLHDLKRHVSDEPRQLRCEWYDEQVFWGARGMEDFSLAFVLAKRRILGRHGAGAVDDAGEWTPLMEAESVYDDHYGGDGKRVLTSKGAELFLRVLDKPLDVLLAQNANAAEHLATEAVM